MSMNTYSLEQKCALVITPEVACAIQLRDTMATGDGMEMVPEPVLDALGAGRTPWDCACDPDFYKMLVENGWMEISDAYDLLESKDIDGIVHCSEFDGSASISSGDGFGDPQSEDIDFEDEFMAYVAPLEEMSLFKAAYESPESLLQEYRSRLSGLLGDDFPYTRFIMDVSGTYVC